MPRRTAIIVLGQDTKDAEALKTLLSAAGSEPGVARRLHQYLESFSADHLHLEAEEVFELFVARLSRGLAASTLLTYTTIMRTYGVRPFDKDAVERRIRARELQLGIRHMAQSAKSEKKNHRRGVTWAHLEALVGPRATDAIRDKEWRAFVWLLMVTGNRPRHVLGAKVQKVYPSSVLLRWGPRKVRGPSLSVLRYEYLWSSQPPEDVLRRWAGLGKKPWLFTSSSNIAAACNVWMTKRGTGHPPILRSSTARGLLSATLYDEYEDGRMTAERFEDLMDHEPKTSRLHYQVGDDNELSD
jgi:hypothetical protein